MNDVRGTFRLAGHPGPDNKIIDPGEALSRTDDEREYRERPGRMLRQYLRKAA